MKEHREKIGILALTIWSIVIFFKNLGVDDVTIMEARNFITAREMVRGGSWLIPTLNGNFRFEKPPLPTWLTAITMKIFHNDTSIYIARIPIAILSVFLVIGVYYFVKTLTKNKALSLTSGVIFSTTFMIMKLGNDNTWDLFSYGLTFLSLLFLLKGMEKEGDINYIFSGILMGGGLLSKGPVPLYGMVLPFFISYIYIYGFKRISENKWKIITTFILGVVVAGIWPSLMIIFQRDIFISVMEKEKSTWTHKHIKSIFYYFDYILYIGIWLVLEILSFYKGWKEKEYPNRKYFKFIFVFNLVSLILLSLIKMKKKRYGIPMFIGTPLLIGTYLHYLMNKGYNALKKDESLSIKIHCSLMIIISILVVILNYLMGYRVGEMNLLEFLIRLFIFGGFTLLFVSGFTKKISIKSIFLGTALLMFTINLVETSWFKKNIMYKKNKDYPYISSLKDERKEDNTVYTIGSDHVITIWNVGSKLKKVEDVENLPKSFLLIDDKKEEEVERILGEGYEIVDVKKYYKYNNKLTYAYKVKEEK